ncbi:outer membrane protein assembly factor BamB family protein [Halalkalicoccus ordinarius]|uniref:outer membrane protein assembly factor BamB family protein n=1 Tax=Halalkalicoccus ordinarius TaxID=3116651 RepID=UPI00300F55AB
MRTRRGLLRTTGGAMVGLGLGGCLDRLHNEELEGPAAESADAQFRDGLQRRGFQDRTAPESVERAWRMGDLNTGEHTAAKASAVLAPTGDVVVPGDNGEVWALSPDGERRWRASVEETERGIHGTPAIAHGAVYVGAYDGALYAFDLESGERIWRRKLGGSIGSSPAYHDGTVYIAVEYPTPSGSVFGVDALDGSVEWEDDRITDHPHSTIAIDREAGRLAVGANDGVLYAWTYPELEFAWEFETGGEIKGPIATADGAAFFGSWDERIYRVDLADGEEEWAFAADDLVMTGPAIRDDVVYAGSHDSNLYALDIDSGEENWRFDTDGSLIGCPVVTPESVLVGSNAGSLYCVARADGATPAGEMVWRASAAGSVSSTPLVTDDGIYFTDRASDERSGSVYKLRAAEP